MANTQQTSSSMVVMGRIVAPYGVFGWLKIVPDTEAFDGLFDYDTWWLGKGDDWREMVVETAKTHNDVLVVKLKGIDDRDAALACKGKQIAVPREQLPEAEENEYYWSDLIGLRVKNKQDVDFGLIVDVFETGANDVIAVRADVIQSEDSTVKAVAKEKPQERLIPFIDDVVLEVDLAAKTMLVDWDADF
ncbi:16S rRNA processing protein RimM [Methylotenera versatilis 301]|uniref:Ribosome maturation factor RimM n=2 Tax=Methylotenera TaxID=359407 RepID=D7DMT5_METV0|nr:16S rRNA processing protein RimM [Methylotenera versatilis 301]